MQKRRKPIISRDLIDDIMTALWVVTVHFIVIH